MKNKLFKSLPYILVAILIGVSVSYAGDLVPPGPPGKSMKSLSDLHELINTGSNTPSTDFTTPEISSSMYSLEVIYDLMADKISNIDDTKIITGTTIFGVAGTLIPHGLPKTGQTGCWDTDGNVQDDCLGGGQVDGGQDGYYKKGVAPAYTDNEDGTITDNATGLMWKKCSEGLNGADCDSGSITTETWRLALADCETDTIASYTDWRLPNIKELFSIIDFQNSDPVVNETFFPNTSSFPYWSSTSYSGFGSAVWTLDFSGGITGAFDKAGGSLVRCVRGE